MEHLEDCENLITLHIGFSYLNETFHMPEEVFFCNDPPFHETWPSSSSLVASHIYPSERSFFVPPSLLLLPPTLT